MGTGRALGRLMRASLSSGLHGAVRLVVVGVLAGALVAATAVSGHRFDMHQWQQARSDGQGVAARIAHLAEGGPSGTALESALMLEAVADHVAALAVIDAQGSVQATSLVSWRGWPATQVIPGLDEALLRRVASGQAREILDVAPHRRVRVLLPYGPSPGWTATPAPARAVVLVDLDLSGRAEAWRRASAGDLALLLGAGGLVLLVGLTAWRRAVRIGPRVGASAVGPANAQGAASGPDHVPHQVRHEVRNAVNGILGLTHLALLQTRDARLTDYLDNIQRSANDLMGAVEPSPDPPRPQPGSAVPQPVPRSVAARARVLVVDDNASARQVLTQMLHQLGMSAHAVEGPDAAMQAVVQADREASAFDVVMLDLQMPGGDGLEAGRRLRALPLRRQPLLMLVSGFSREHILARAQGVDLAAVLVKPVSAEQLREQLMQVLQG